MLTINDLAAYLRLSPSTIYKLAKAGKLPGRKVGGAWRFQKIVIDQWLMENNHA
jgi:excisionase family DNA binding protein